MSRDQQNNNFRPSALLISSTPVFKCAIITKEYGIFTICSSSCSFQRQYERYEPDIKSLSLLQIQSLASEFSYSPSFVESDDINCSKIEQERRLADLLEGRNNVVSNFEIRLFSNESNNRSNNNNMVSDGGCIVNEKDNEPQKIISFISEIKGLKERLMDECQSHTTTMEGNLERFLSKSETIVSELISAIHQRQQKIQRMSLSLGSAATSSFSSIGVLGGRKRKRQGVISDSRANDGKEALSFDYLPIRYYESLQKQMSQLDALLNNPTYRSSAIINTADGDHLKSNELNLNEDLNQVSIIFYDKEQRSHDLVLELQPNFPIIGPIWTCDLPIDFDPIWKTPNTELTKYVNLLVDTSSASTGGLAFMFQQYAQVIDKCQSLWNELDDIDKNTWVLEPSLPARRDCTERRLAIRTGLSIHMALDPERPRSAPLSVRLIGGGKDVIELRNSFQKYCNVTDKSSLSQEQPQDTQQHHWSEELSVRSNLGKCFGFDLPSPEKTEKADYLAECAICYSHVLPSSNENDGENQEGDKSSSCNIPNITCGNPSCARSYHESCLSEWLHSLPTARISFDRIFGTCPYCCESISIKT